MVQTTYVKWRTPAEELAGIAALAATLVKQGNMRSESILLAVPNRNWAAQTQRACERVGLQTAVCIAPAQRDRATRQVLATLDLLSQPGSAKARAAWAEVSGCAIEEASRLIEEQGSMRGHTLARRAGLASIPAYEQMLPHLEGEEDASQLGTLLRAQLEHPAPPSRGPIAPIVHHRAVEGPCDWVFLIGCVEGLLPCAAALEATDTRVRNRELEADRKAFFAAGTQARERLVVSGFASISAQTARQARIRSMRRKKEHGSLVAITSPTRFLDEMGAERPPTIGGQTLLREYDLN